MRVVRQRLEASQVRVPFTRWSDACSCVEISFDNGESWMPSPENDPRTGCGFRAPPRTGSDPKCDAAASMVEVIRMQVDAAIDAATAVGLATSLLAIVTSFVPGMNILVTIFVAVASALLAFGSAALSADFTEENYAKLVCIFYENTDDEGQITTAQLDVVLDEIEAEWGISVIYPVVELLIEIMGENGFSNAGALGDEVGDCEDCPDCFPLVDFRFPSCYTLQAYTPGFNISTLDNAFGNPAPSARSGNKTTTTRGFGIRVYIPVGRVLSQATYQVYYEITAGNNPTVLGRSITMYTAGGSVLASFDSSASGFAQNTWHTVTVNYAGSLECGYIIIAAHRTGTSGLNLDGNIWVDNVTMTEA